MTISLIVQTIAVVVSLGIVVSGWVINWRQRINDKKPQMVATVVTRFLGTPLNEEPRKTVQLRNIGGSTAIIHEFRIVKHTQTGEELLSDGSTNLNLPMFPTQMLDSNRPFDNSSDYTVTVRYSQLHSKKVEKFEVTLSGRAFRHVDLHPLMNAQ